ncbi:MAG: dTDP-4-amino-4,6-dideoxygalactose transaminase [Thermodesulfobacteriota bacterium]|jgi:dTDP-4-amino-4,6-dideoxygalactose transaminase|nr:dTDP-4-amino-4,6-dideoxygalactose transaminase [Thermodesulfobacteriota bacterium]
MIVFNKPPLTGNEEKYVIEAMAGQKISGDGYFGRKCQNWFEEKLGCHKALLTPSCTHALEMAAILVDIQPGDEVIMPSYTFVSTANAFVLRGAKIVFVDIRSDTLNLDENLLEEAITARTKVIVPVHYGGVGCAMDVIMDIASRHGLFVIEDAAQGMMAEYQGRPLGTFGHLAAYSFHETKNYTSGGEGGLLIINDAGLVGRAEIIREKGTNRCQFFRGMVAKYSWVDIGSSYLPSELQAAYLWGQLEVAEQINANRLASWNGYLNSLRPLQRSSLVSFPQVPHQCRHNSHMFYLKTRDLRERTALIRHLQEQGIMAVFHYVPLHDSPAGQKFGEFKGKDRYTTTESNRLVRLPMFYGLKQAEIEKISQAVTHFYKS